VAAGARGSVSVRRIHPSFAGLIGAVNVEPAHELGKGAWVSPLFMGGEGNAKSLLSCARLFHAATVPP